MIKSFRFLLSLLVITALAFMLQSCEHGPLAEVYIKMKNATWDRFDQKYFEIPIEKTSKNLDITLVVRNTSKFNYDELPVYIILTTPDGEERVHEMSLRLRQDG